MTGGPGSGGKPPPGDAPTPAPSETGQPDPVAALKAWESEQSLSTAGWFPRVRERQFVGDATLFVHTDLVDDADAADMAQRICGAYATYSATNEALKVVMVRAVDGQRLTQCGPGF